MKQVLLSALISCFLISCGKHHDKPDNSGGTPDPAPAGTLRIKSSSGFTYTYDSQGRLVNSFYDNSFPARLQYAYTETTVTGTDFFTNGNSSERIIYTIGPNGLATGEKYNLPAGGTPVITTYTYNTERQLVEEVAGEEGKAPVIRTIHYYSKGNRDSLKSFLLSNGKLLTYMRFEYYTDKPNLISPENNGISYLGVSSVNLLKKFTRIESGDTTVTNLTYEFDARKRPAKLHIIEDGASLSDVVFAYIEIP